MNIYDNHPKMKHIYIGVDTHKTMHHAVIINCFNEKLDTLTFNNNNQGFNELLTMTNKYINDGLTAIYGLEDTKHLGHALATFLMAKNCAVRVVNSTLTYNERKKYPIISKTDDIDATCIAKVTLDNLADLPIATNDEIYWTLKQITKMKKSIVFDNIKAKNKLHAQLLHHYPYYTEFFSGFDGKTALDFWEQFPSPKHMTLSMEELSDFLYEKSKGVFAMAKAKTIYELIHNEKYESMNYQNERNILITMLVKQIKHNNKQMLEIDNSIISLYDELGFKLHTIRSLSKVTSAEIIAHIGNINRFSSKDKLARYAGIAPVNFSSGGKDKSIRNEFGNRTLNSHIYNLAVRSISPGNSRQEPFNAIFLEYYHRKLSHGKNRQQALTCVMRRLVNIIYVMLKNNTEYKMSDELKNECLKTYNEKIKPVIDKSKSNKKS